MKIRNWFFIIFSTATQDINSYSGEIVIYNYVGYIYIILIVAAMEKIEYQMN
jgi:hypothetical protein